MSHTYRVGVATAYGAAKRGGYTKTYDEYCADMARYAEIQQAVDEAESAADAAAAAEATAAGYAEMTKAAYGAPLVAATAAAMTDTTRVYVYTGSETGYTAGDWYFWDGSAWTDGGVYNSEALSTDKTLSYEDKAADAKAVRAALTYVPIDITSFSITVPSGGKAEIGSTVETVKLAYTLNKTLTSPETLTLSDGTTTESVLGETSPIELDELSITEDVTYTLAAEDGGSPVHAHTTASKTSTLSFLPRAYWGAAEIPGTVNSAFVQGLSDSALTNTRARTITVNAISGKYIWYAVPVSFGACTFKVGGFDGGFEAAQTVSITNAYGETISYNVYRSTNADLGSTTVVVS